MNAVALDHLVYLWRAYESTQAEADKWAQAADLLKRRIQAEMDQYEEATIGGQTVATYRHTGQFSTRRFTLEQPDLATKYTRTVTREELDLEAVKAEQPDLFAVYRARRFERKHPSP
ncbi:MAG TPA: hypothetical protein VK453_24485 [Micromonosporaceae bacterium]|nr:hypothetical protein [Micromonosporaceae bacterium]